MSSDTYYNIMGLSVMKKSFDFYYFEAVACPTGLQCVVFLWLPFIAQYWTDFDHFCNQKDVVKKYWNSPAGQASNCTSQLSIKLPTAHHSFHSFSGGANTTSSSLNLLHAFLHILIYLHIHVTDLACAFDLGAILWSQLHKIVFCDKQITD